MKIIQDPSDERLFYYAKMTQSYHELENILTSIGVSLDDYQDEIISGDRSLDILSSILSKLNSLSAMTEGLKSLVTDIQANQLLPNYKEFLDIAMKSIKSQLDDPSETTESEVK